MIDKLLGLVGIALVATPAAADDVACAKAVREHGNFKAIISDDDSGKPQFETVERNGDVVVVTRYVDGRKRMIRRTEYGLFSKENIMMMGGNTVRFGLSHSIDVRQLMPLKPNSTAQYRTAMVREGDLSPQFSDVTLTVGDKHEFSLGGCTFDVIDLTVETRTQANNLVATFKGAFSPDLDYPVDSSYEVVSHANVKTFVTKLRSIESWSPGSAESDQAPTP